MDKIIKVIDEKKEVHIRKWNEERLKNILKDLVKEQVYVIDKEKVKDYLKGHFVDIII